MAAGGRSRDSVYAELVASLLDARRDPASDRFDVELARAQATGRIDAETARLLRWWQRESMRGVVDHARSVLPAALIALDRADDDASEAADSAERSWRSARRGPLPPETDDGHASVPAVPEDLPARIVLPGSEQPTTQTQETPAGDEPENTGPDDDRPDDAEPEVRTAEERAHSLRLAPTRPAAPPTRPSPAAAERPVRSGWDRPNAPGADATTTPPESPSTGTTLPEPADFASRRRRLLVAGLTVLPENH